MEAWVKHAKVSAEGYWQGHFLGNALRDLFEDLSFLKDEYGCPKIPKMKPFIVAIKSYNAVQISCAGMELHPDYAERINQFCHDYLVLEKNYGFSAIIKAHDTFFHYIQGGKAKFSGSWVS